MAVFVRGGKKDFLSRNNSRQSGRVAYRTVGVIACLRQVTLLSVWRHGETARTKRRNGEFISGFLFFRDLILRDFILPILFFWTFVLRTFSGCQWQAGDPTQQILLLRREHPLGLS